MDQSLIVARLREQARDVERILAGLDEAALAKRVVAEKWSLKELVAHLWRVQQIFEERIEAMLAQDNPPIVRYEPEGDPDFDRLAARPAAELARGFFDSRERLAARLGALDPAGWRRAGRHPEFRRYDVAFQVEYMLWHEAHHIYQMIQRRAAPRRAGLTSNQRGVLESSKTFPESPQAPVSGRGVPGGVRKRRSGAEFQPRRVAVAG